MALAIRLGHPIRWHDSPDYRDNCCHGVTVPAGGRRAGSGTHWHSVSDPALAAAGPPAGLRRARHLMTGRDPGPAAGPLAGSLSESRAKCPTSESPARLSRSLT
jgi:hypothetical protein